MEFIQEFAVIQGTLLTLQKRFGPLKNITDNDSGTQEKIETIVNSLLKIINSLERTDNSVNIKMRQISLFLVLNSDLKACELLKEDTNCGHLIESAPTLSNYIMINVFSTPLLSKYFHELIVLCPPVLSVELLEVAVSKLKQDCSTVPLPCVATFIKAVYVKLLTLKKQNCDHICEVNCSALKFMQYFTKFLEFLSDFSRINSKNLNSHLEDFGKTLLTSLDLVTSCLTLFIHFVEVDDDVLSVYKMKISFNYEIWHQESDVTIFDAVHEQLLSVLCVQIAHITVDVWLGWAELESKFVSKYSLQKDIAESMYKCREVIQSAKKNGIKSQLFEGLICMLSSMSVKPHDEDDEIKEADMALILNRISDQLFCRRKWMIALFTKYSDKVFKEECVECINKNIDLLDFEIVVLFLEKICASIENGEVDAVSEKIKGVFLHAANLLCLEEQLQLLEKFFDKCGVNSYLCSQEYNSKVTKIFNTAVDSTEISQDVKFMEFVNVCLQNPLDMMKRLLEHSVASDKQAQIMGNIIIMLRPFHSLCIDKNDQEPRSLMVKILYEIMQKRRNMEFSDTSFIFLITELTMNNALPLDDFLKNNLLPLFHESLNDSSWSDMLLWLETLQVFVDNTVLGKSTLNASALLLTLAQVMELSRKNVFSFSCAALTACEYAINISGMILESLTEVDEDSTLMHLRENLVNLISPINLFYFFDLWKKSGNYSYFTADWKIYLLHWMYMEKCNLQPPWGSTFNFHRKKIILELAQLLPVCVKSEWRTVVQNLHNLMYPVLGESSSTYVFECVIDAIQIMSLLSSAPGITNKEQECAFSCIDFCVRNLSAVAKEELIRKPETIAPKTVSTLFQKIIILNYVLPEVVKDSGAGILLNMQVDFISKAISDMEMCPNEEDEEKQIIKSQWNEVLRNMAISITMLNDLKIRQALARKLQEGLNVV